MEPRIELAEFIRRHLLARYGLSKGEVVGAVEPGEMPYWVSNPKGARILYSTRVPVPGTFPIPYGTMVDAVRHMSNWTMIIPGYNAFVDYRDLTPLDPRHPHDVFEPPSPLPPVVSGPDPIDFGPLSRGCPRGMWWDPLQQICRPISPLPPSPSEF